MKGLVLIAAILVAPVAFGHELDAEQTVSAEQKEFAKQLPQTTVIRINKKTNEVEVIHLKEKLAVGEKVTNAKFERVALNTEITGVKYTSLNEKDVNSSTSSWGWGYGNRGYWGGGAYIRGPNGGSAVIVGGGGYARGGYGYGYGYSPYYNNYYNGYYPSYSVNNCYYGYNSYNSCNYGGYYPSYYVGGYTYNYSNYYSYSDAYYNYNCYNYGY